MNHVLYNIAIIILSVGIIMLTIYITKVSSPTYLTYEQQLIEKQKYQDKMKEFKPDNVYNYMVSKEYKKMFDEPEEWLGYKSFDENEPNQKLFIK